MILMLLSKDKESRVEANNRITWLLKTTLNKSIDLPDDIFVIEFDDLNEKIEDPIGEYNVCSINLYYTFHNFLIKLYFFFFLGERFR